MPLKARTHHHVSANPARSRERDNFAPWGFTSHFQGNSVRDQYLRCVIASAQVSCPHYSRPGLRSLATLGRVTIPIAGAAVPGGLKDKA
jgi:hypothetical protein